MNPEPAAPDSPELAMNLLRHVVVGLVRRDGIALSTQQFGVFLACYLCPEASTLRGLVQELDLPRLVVMRSLDKLTELGLIVRTPDPRDNRNQIMQLTENGHAMLADLRGMAVEVKQPDSRAA